MTMHEGGTPAAVVDLLSAHARWMTRRTIIDLVRERRPHWRPNRVDQALSRLVRDGVVKKRTELNPTTAMRARSEYFCDVWSVARLEESA